MSCSVGRMHLASEIGPVPVPAMMFRNRGIELNRTAHPNMETKTQKKWYHLTPVPPASNGVKGAQVATAAASLLALAASSMGLCSDK